MAAAVVHSKEKAKSGGKQVTQNDFIAPRCPSALFSPSPCHSAVPRLNSCFICLLYSFLFSIPS